MNSIDENKNELSIYLDNNLRIRKTAATTDAKDINIQAELNFVIFIRYKDIITVGMLMIIVTKRMALTNTSSILTNYHLNYKQLNSEKMWTIYQS